MKKLICFYLVIFVAVFAFAINEDLETKTANTVTRQNMPVIILDAGHGGFDGGAVSGNILEKDINRVGRYYYANRNYIYTNKKLGTKKDLLKAYINKGVLEPIKILKNARDHKLYRLSVSIKGTVKGTTFHPKVEKYD